MVPNQDQILRRPWENPQCSKLRGSRAGWGRNSAEFLITAATYSFFGICGSSIPETANERTGGLKHPVALVATEALKVRVLNPDLLVRHCRSISLTICETYYYPVGIRESMCPFPGPDNAEWYGLL